VKPGVDDVHDCTLVILASAAEVESELKEVEADDEVVAELFDDNKLAACAVGILGRIPVRSGGEEKFGCDAIDGILPLDAVAMRSLTASDIPPNPLVAGGDIAAVAVGIGDACFGGGEIPSAIPSLVIFSSSLESGAPNVNLTPFK